jgi:hypothetical protein
MLATFTVVGMTTSSNVDVSFTGDDLVLRLASSAYLARVTGSSRRIALIGDRHEVVERC